LFVAAVALTSLGFVFAWNSESTQGFHAIMNLVLMPLWLLSGAFFPAPVPVAGDPLSQFVMHWAIRLNPLSYAVAGARHTLHAELAWEGVWLPTLASSWIVTLLFAAVAFGAACLAASRPSTGDLP
jgi:ABC-2 type transport system permease protein